MQGNAHEKRNCWVRGNGPNSMRGELRRGIRLKKKMLNRRVRHKDKMQLRGCGYKRLYKTLRMVDFT